MSAFAAFLSAVSSFSGTSPGSGGAHDGRGSRRNSLGSSSFGGSSFASRSSSRARSSSGSSFSVFSNSRPHRSWSLPSSSPRSQRSAEQRRPASIELTPMPSFRRPEQKLGLSGVDNEQGPLSPMSKASQANGLKRELSPIRQGEFDELGAGSNSASMNKIANGKEESGSKNRLTPLQRQFSDNSARAQRQQAFIDKYMPHAKAFSTLQSGIESLARGFLGIADKPKKTGNPKKTDSPAPSFPDLSGVERKAYDKPGAPSFDSQDLARQAKHAGFIRDYVPMLSPLIGLQQGLQHSFRSLLGLPTKRADQPNMGQKIERIHPAALERDTRSPIERNFSKDPDRAARQQQFVSKYMPHVAAISKLQSSFENSLRNVIKGPKDSSVDPRASVGATL